MGGTLLLNAVLDPELRPQSLATAQPVLDGLVTISSPLDLIACSRFIDRPRNRLYINWLLRGLRRQTLADPHGVTEQERSALAHVRTIRQFDAAITAPAGATTRWSTTTPRPARCGASPKSLRRPQRWARRPAPTPGGSPDPGDPRRRRPLGAGGPSPGPGAGGHRPPGGTASGGTHPGRGHNGFHAPGGCWSDRLATRWLEHLALGDA
ncbi:hypothetical protein [Cyanobium sp. ATX-6F1]|uniref:hypothetical protein n=1 Tax=Cyanobium sp. ATX-6F1 TaxID=3137388 RepID=UPI0039BE564D